MSVEELTESLDEALAQARVELAERRQQNQPVAKGIEFRPSAETGCALAKLLLEHGARLDVANRGGQTPIDLARLRLEEEKEETGKPSSGILSLVALLEKHAGKGEGQK